MAEIAHAVRVANVGPEYNNFLYATIGADRNGMLLSVLSAMARMNLDPWQEAASLAELPGKAAASRLTSLIAAIPAGPSVSDEPGLIAARLIKLLPKHGRISQPPPQESNLPPYLINVGKALSSKGAMYVVLLLIAFTLGAKWFFANKPPIANLQTSVSETSSPQRVPLSH